MQLGKVFLIIPLLALFYISYSDSKDHQQLEQWRELCPGKQFCFIHPKSLIPADVQGIDSIAGQLNSDDTTLTYDLGWYSSQFDELSHATSAPIIIDGHYGTLLRQDNKIALAIPSVSGKVRFSMLIEFKSTVNIELTDKIFKSIRFTLIQ